MGKARIGACVTSMILVLMVTYALRALDGVSTAQTVPGDILRGEGQYLRGRGLYDYYSAKGRRIDAGTEIMIQKWNAEVYAAYKRERATHIQYRKGLTGKTEQEALRRMAEKEERLRNNPTDTDVISGDALNALLVDLSDPEIGSASWRNAPVPLPAGFSIRSLFFRFAPKFGDKGAGVLSNNLIALGRLDPSRGWPLYMAADKVGTECKSYEAAHKRLLERSEKGELRLDDVTRLDRALTALKAKVFEAVPAERNFRTTAMHYVGDMQAATKIFDASTIDFAQEMIRDTHDYTPVTVGELLAFLRKYRLYFASAAGRPEDGELYRVLFGLLRQQKEALGIKPGAALAVQEGLLKEGSVWKGTLRFTDAATKAAPKKAAPKKAAPKKAMPGNDPNHVPYRLVVTTVNGAHFSGESWFNERFQRQVEGTVGGGRISYRETGKNGNTFNFDGDINGDTIKFEFHGRGPAGNPRSGRGEMSSR